MLTNERYPGQNTEGTGARLHIVRQPLVIAEQGSTCCTYRTSWQIYPQAAYNTLGPIAGKIIQSVNPGI